MHRPIVVILALALAALAAQAHADASPPSEPLVPQAPMPLPTAVEPRGDLATAPPPLRNDSLGVNVLLPPALRGIPVWRMTGVFASDLYGVSVRRADADFALGVAPVSTSAMPEGYTAGFVWKLGPVRFGSDLLRGRNWIGRSTAESLWTATIEMADDLSLRIRYHARSMSDSLTPGRESTIDGGLEMAF
jgi:hypothetical protein